jgi:hypothetical protein
VDARYLANAFKAAPSKWLQSGSLWSDVGLDRKTDWKDYGPNEPIMGEPLTKANEELLVKAATVASLVLPVALEADMRLALPPPPVSSHGVFFFGQDILPYIDGANATLGKPGNQTFFMPLEGASVVRTGADAARYSGMAPSAANAYVTGGDMYGVSFPLEYLPTRLPTTADSGGFAHFLPGGNTAVRGAGPSGGYLVNPTREFVTPGGDPMPQGSVLFRLGTQGEWIPLRKF